MKTFVVLSLVVCGSGFGATQLPRQSADDKKPAREQPPPQVKKVAVGKNVVLEVQGEQRRVLIDAYVCLRAGALELFLTRKRTKEHESILAADIDARDVHTALYLARAEQGRPVPWAGKVVPPSGMSIKITLEYEVQGKKTRVPAQQWVRVIKTKKNLAHDWVFAGSGFSFDPDMPTNVSYGANNGAVISVSNFAESLLDLPIESTSAGSDLLFEAHTQRIPPEETRVLVILEPMPAKMKEKTKGRSAASP